MKITFGSDGYRGVIGHAFTRESVARITFGLADYLKGRYPEATKPLPVPVGYDTRFLSRPLACFAVTILQNEGFAAQLSQRPCTSPYLSFATKELEAPAGMQFTASHNPPYYNGVKLKGPHGGSMVPEDVEMVEFYANAIDPGRLATKLFTPGMAKQGTLNLDKEYRKALRNAAHGEGAKEQQIIVDYMHGAACGVNSEILKDWFTVTTEIRQKGDPLFGGKKPEPMPELLQELCSQVVLDGHDAIGLAFDGDGDRLAVVDETGQLLAPHELFSVLLEYLVTQQGAGNVVKSVSTSLLVDRVAKEHACKVIEVPVGFKHVSDAMLEHGAIMGGEESGGIAFGQYLPERDGLLMALMVLKAKAAAGTTLHEMVENIYAKFGRPVFSRRDIALPPEVDPFDFKLRLASLAELHDLAGDEILSLNHRDGMKLITAEGWVLVRPSGTEHLARIYSEAEDAGKMQAYAQAVMSALGL